MCDIKIEIISIEDEPKKPVLPRRPPETYHRTEVVWTSNEDDITLADLILLLPNDVKANNVTLCIVNDGDGAKHTAVTYDHAVINHKFKAQLEIYEKRMREYELLIVEYVKQYDEWIVKKKIYDASIEQLKHDIELAFVECEQNVV